MVYLSISYNMTVYIEISKYRFYNTYFHKWVEIVLQLVSENIYRTMHSSHRPPVFGIPCQHQLLRLLVWYLSNRSCPLPLSKFRVVKLEVVSSEADSAVLVGCIPSGRYGSQSGLLLKIWTWNLTNLSPIPLTFLYTLFFFYLSYFLCNSYFFLRIVQNYLFKLVSKCQPSL
jgi:hypothetical protein